MLRLIQFRDARGGARVAVCDDEGAAHVVNGVTTTYELAWAAISAGISLAEQVKVTARARLSISTRFWPWVVSVCRLRMMIQHI